MGITDRVEAFINELIRQQDNGSEWIEIGRNELASIFGCVPSQINYVISTRFSPERGYAVQSKRGGGGCIKIRRLTDACGISGVAARIGASADLKTAQSAVKYLFERGALDEQTARVILAAVSDESIPLQNPQKNAVRAAILKNALLAANVSGAI